MNSRDYFLISWLGFSLTEIYTHVCKNKFRNFKKPIDDII